MSAWEPLARDEPVPGDPAALRAGARRYADLVEHIGAATLALRSFADRPLGQSAAVERVTAVAGETWDDVTALRERYVAAAEALESYAGVLDSAQDDAARLRVLARHEGETQHTAAVVAKNTAQELRALAGDPGSAAHAAALAAHRAALDQIDAAGQQIDALRRRLADVQDVVRAAGDRAADAIRTAVRADGVRDSWFERVGLAVLENISWIAGAISAAVGAAALVVVWIPAAGQLAAAILAGVALASGAVALGSDVVLQSHGRKTWADVAWSAVGVGGGLAGRAVGASTKAFRATAAPTVRVAARRAAARPASGPWRPPHQVGGRRGARLAKRFGGSADERRLMLRRLDPRARRMHLTGIDLESAHMYRALSYTAQRDPALAAAIAPQLRVLERAARLQTASTAVTVAQVPVTTHSLASR